MKRRGEAATAYAFEGSAFTDASACSFFRRKSASLYFHCSRVAPVELAISYWIRCFSAARALSLAFHSVSSSALAFAGSRVDGEGSARASLDVLGVTPPFVKNCTLSREPEVTTASELLWRGLRGSLDQIEDLFSVSSVDLDITPIPLVISGLSVQFFTNEE